MTDSTYDSANPAQPSKLPEDQILRTDALGRVHTPPELREAILDEFERSGLSGTKFAKARGINYQTFASWVQKRKKRLGENPDGPSIAPNTTQPFDPPVKHSDNLTFLELIPETPGAAPTDTDEEPLQIDLSHGIKLQIQSERQITLAAKLIKTLTRETKA